MRSSISRAVQLAVTIAAFAGPSIAARADERRAAEAAAGAKIYERLCASCHGASGRGDGADGAALSTAPADLTSIAERRRGLFDEGAVAEAIDGRRAVATRGDRSMPLWGVIFRIREYPGQETEVSARRRIDLLVEYLRSIQRDGSQRYPSLPRATER